MCELNLNKILEEVIEDATKADIPISKKINRQIIIDYNIEQRAGICYRNLDTYEIHLSYKTTRGKEKSIKDVVAHEVMHTCFCCMDHNFFWKHYSQIMNEKYGYNIKIKYKWSDIL
nr:MAG TPA: Protein of unknown function DUF45 [Bacteriophage sp.]